MEGELNAVDNVLVLNHCELDLKTFTYGRSTYIRPRTRYRTSTTTTTKTFVVVVVVVDLNTKKKRPTFFILASFSFCCFSRSSLRSLSCSSLCFSSRMRLNLADKRRALTTAWSLVIPFRTFKRNVNPPLRNLLN